MAKYYFPNEEPIGKRFSLTKQEPDQEREIVGVVKDAKYDDLRKSNPRIIYLSNRQEWTRPAITLAVQTTVDPNGAIAAVRQAIQSVGKDIPITKIRSLDAHLDERFVAGKFLGDAGRIVAEAAGDDVFAGSAIEIVLDVRDDFAFGPEGERANAGFRGKLRKQGMLNAQRTRQLADQHLEEFFACVLRGAFDHSSLDAPEARDTARQALGEAGFEAAYQRGRGLGHEEAIALAEDAAGSSASA